MRANYVYRRSGKRALDLLLAASGLLFLSPLLAGIALLVRINLGSPIFFRHQRPGMGGMPFILLKFRTMNDARDEEGNLLPDDARKTRFGSFLRASSMDELPELFNVLKGDMSLVGPRPLMMQYLPRYNAQQNRRHEVRPGITGWAQINGRNLLSWEDRFEKDIWYVDHISLSVDFRILFATVWTVLARQGISAPNHFSAPEFMGSGGAAKSDHQNLDL